MNTVVNENRNEEVSLPNHWRIKADGRLVVPELHLWRNTKRNAYNTWNLFQKGTPSAQINRSITGLGVKDILNHSIIKTVKENQDLKVIFKIRRFQDGNIQKLFNQFFQLKGFDEYQDTPVEILHIVLLGILKYLYQDLIDNLSLDKKEELIARLQSFDTNNLNIPPLKAKYHVQHYSSLVGKDFKVLIQAAQFVFFPFIQESKHKMWTSLSHLCSIVFQTHIINLESYLSKLKYYTKDFLIKLISTNAQWVNKPKFHISLHLTHSIMNFGPASLFATEKFESYNGVVRQASIHSNCQNPSHDIANSFLIYSALRYCFSGGILQAESPTQDKHHAPARIPTPPIQPLEVLNAVHDGLSELKKCKNKKGKNKAPESITSINPSLA
ncbi:hypothetical protein BY996DRAFT_6408075 [Phakopsora pachyrhizi]|nr:hypothetical protein BY996DRAFT_6408075 [Phakopsora pachyrhizi]